MTILHFLEAFKTNYCSLERGDRHPEIAGKIYVLFSWREGSYLSSASQRRGTALADA